MISKMFLVASAATISFASAAGAQTVLNTDLPEVTGGNATTTTDANGTVTTVTGTPRRGATPTVGSWYQANVGGGASVGITNTYSNDGNGAAYFNSVSGDGKADLQYNFSAPVLLSQLQSVSYDWYVDPATNTTSAFQPVLRFNMTKNGAFAGQLILEHVYQNQTAAPEGVWTSENATLSSGIWWASNVALGPTFANANGGQKTLAQWIADNGNDTLRVTGVNIGIGSGWNGTFSGGLDNVNYSFANGPSADVDFAVAAAVPEPATWAMMIGGFGLVGAAARRRSKQIVLA